MIARMRMQVPAGRFSSASGTLQVSMLTGVAEESVLGGQISDQLRQGLGS